MRDTFKTPAELLGSVSLRYRLPWRSAPSSNWLFRFSEFESFGNGESGSKPPTSNNTPSTSQFKESFEQQRDIKLSQLEATLFLAREPISSRRLSQIANLADATEARTLIRRLNELYDQSGRAFRVEEVADGYQLFTRPQLGSWLRRLKQLPPATRLSVPAMETLAVVAYRQPTPRAEIDAIRGVNCGEILRQLLDRDLIRIAGRSDDLGRPYLYATTKRFLQIFGLRNLEDLPKADVFRGLSPTDNHMKQATKNQSVTNLEEDSHVRLTTATMLSLEEELARARTTMGPKDDDEDFEEDDDAEVEDDEDEDLEDEDFDEEDEEFFEDEEDFDDEDDEEEDDEDFEDEEWEEVDDTEEEEAEEEDDWDDDEDDEDWDDDEDADDEDEGDWE